MKKILIYLNIPWQFIKQRPQFMAEKLGEYFEVLVYYNKPYKKTYIVGHEATPNSIQLKKGPKIPRKHPILNRLDNKLQQSYLKKPMKAYDILWLMHPNEYEIVKNQIKGKTIIYDCMDDYSQFPHLSKGQQDYLIKLEAELIQRADYVFYTSETLQEVHRKRYNIQKKVYIINNGFEPVEDKVEDKKIKEYLTEIKGLKLVYIGAIAPWFDIELIEEILEQNKEIHIILFGPSEIDLPQKQRLHHYGKIPHSSIYTAMNYADVLIMPFKINELILSVDPIKMYEYIASGKKVIAPYYKEMDKFKDFINIYHNKGECLELIRRQECLCVSRNLDAFMMSNTWEARARQVANILKGTNNRILITGCKGQLGIELSRQLKQLGTTYTVIATDSSILNITDYNEVRNFMHEYKPHIVINCAAYTQVDQAEDESDQAYKVNAIGAKYMAEASEEIGAKLVHISTDYVFDGVHHRPYTEKDRPHPINQYGMSKLQGEEAVRAFCTRHFIIRTAWLYGQGSNFVRTMLTLAKSNTKIDVVGDQFGSPTSTKDLVRVIIALMQTEYYGIYHGSCQGACSWYDLAVEVFKIKNIPVKVNKVMTQDFPRPAPRPQYTVLENAALKQLNLDTFRPWQEALADYLEQDKNC